MWISDTAVRANPCEVDFSLTREVIRLSICGVIAIFLVQSHQSNSHMQRTIANGQAHCIFRDLCFRIVDVSTLHLTALTGTHLHSELEYVLAFLTKK